MIGVLLVMVACAAGPDPAEQTDAAVWLEQIEARAGDVRTLTAKVTYIREQALLGDEQRRYGTLVYEAGPPAKFRVHFDGLLVDEARHEMDKTYVFDGRYLVERDEDERVWSRWELAREGEQVDLLALGEGPFALPLNMKKDAVLQRFDVAPGSENEQGKLIHLVLTPKVEMDVSKVELWFDRETLLPVRAKQAEGSDTTDVKLRETVVNPKDVKADFDTSPPIGANWQVNDHPLPVEEKEDAGSGEE